MREETRGRTSSSEPIPTTRMLASVCFPVSDAEMPRRQLFGVPRCRRRNCDMPSLQFVQDPARTQRKESTGHVIRDAGTRPRMADMTWPQPAAPHYANSRERALAGLARMRIDCPTRKPNGSDWAPTSVACFECTSVRST